jgi:AraC-like DNA-binding protein
MNDLLSYLAGRELMKERIPIAEDHDGVLGLIHDSRGLTEVHSHDELEFNLVVGGSTYYIVDNKRYLLTAGTLIWLFPWQEHVLVDYDRDFSMWVAVLRPELVSRLSSGPNRAVITARDPGTTFVHRLPLAGWQQLAGLLASVAAAQGDPERFNHGIAYCSLEAWNACKHGAKLESGADLSPIVGATLRILSRVNGCATLTETSQQLEVSESWLSRAFHRETGTRYVDYCNRLKLMRFLEIRKQLQGANLTEIALRAGFGSYAQFFRVHKQATGRSPRDSDNTRSDSID